MWNSSKIKALTGAVLITATIQGSLLWRMNSIATEGMAGVAQEVAGNVLVPATESGPDIRYVTLDPVVVVGRRTAFMAEQPAQAGALAAVTQGLCLYAVTSTTALAGMKSRQASYC